MIAPYISKKMVRQALDSMLVGSATSTPGLSDGLALVDLFVLDPTLPPADNSRQYAINTILTNFITDALTWHRGNFEIEPPLMEESKSDAALALQRDAQQQSQDLIGWSLLYYRYVRVDLSISPGDLSTLLHVDDRTLRRYQGYAIERLRDLLVSAEQRVRIQLRRSVLRSQIRYPVPSSLYGRDQILVQLQQLSVPRHVLLSGAGGIGKTAVVGTMLKHLIDADDLDAICWIDKPQSVKFVQDYLHQNTLKETPLSLKQFTLLYRMAVVLDDIAAISFETDELHMLLADLSEAWVFLTHHTYVLLSSDTTHIALQEIDKEAAIDLIGELRKGDDTKEFAHSLWARVGGNPWAIKLAANSLSNFFLTGPLIGSDSLKQIFMSSYTVLDPSSQDLLFMLAILPHTRASTPLLSAVWYDFEAENHHLLKLLSCGLLDLDHDTQGFSLHSAARENIRNLYDSDPMARERIDTITRRIQGYNQENLETIEHILRVKWPVLDAKQALTWMLAYSEAALGAGHFAVWAEILAQPDLPHELLMKQAICHRHLGVLALAIETLEHVIWLTGADGDFDCQGRALLELAIAYRNQGRYQAALKSLSRLADGKYEGFSGRAVTIRAQIAVDQGDLRRAQKLLENQPRTLANLALLSEMSAAASSWWESQQFIDMALAQARQPQELGRLHAALARLHAQQENFDDAEMYFLLALSSLETLKDAFSLARCQSNFAALMLEQGLEFEYAEQLLLDSEQRQTIIDDQVGLMFTKHNLQALYHKLAIDDQ